MVWRVVKFKDFHDLFYWRASDIIEVSQAVAFFCMNLTWSLLLPSGARLIPNMNIASFSWRYQSGTIALLLLVASRIIYCPRFVHFPFPCLHSQSIWYHAILYGTRKFLLFLLCLPIMILQVEFASELRLYHHLIVSCHSCLRNWILLTVLFPFWSNLQNGCQIFGFKVLRIIYSL